MIGTIENELVMIQFTHGNLLETDAEALVNTVNCVGVMGKGIALQFKQAFPANYAEYEKACKAGRVKLGHMLVVPTDQLVNPRYIINFPTKQHWKGKSKFADIQAGLTALIEEVKRLKLSSIAVPALGAGNGGLDWLQVKPLITSAFASAPDVTVYLFEPQRSPQADQMPIGTTRPHLTNARAALIQLLEIYARLDYETTKLEVQKLAYFLQAAGEPLKLNYQKHLYGPYAENLNKVLQILEGHYIRGYGDRKTTSQIHLLPGAVGEATSYLESNAGSTQLHIRRVADLVEGYETPSGLELLATVHWVMTESDFAKYDVQIAIMLVHSWNPRKRERFDARHIQKAWQRLRDMQWVKIDAIKTSLP